MALTLFMDGFDYYATEHIGMKWLNAAGWEILPTSGRNGGGCLSPTGAADISTPVMDSAFGVTISFAAKRLVEAAWTITLESGAGDAATLTVATDGNITLASGIDSHDFSYSLASEAWRYIVLSAQNVAGTLSGELKVYVDTVLAHTQSYEITTEETGALDAATISANDAGAVYLDDFYIESAMGGNGDMRVVAHEADATVNNVADSWTASDGTSALHDCVTATDSTESLYIKTTCDGTGNSPNLIEFSSASLSPLPDTYGTQIVAWMSVDNDATLYSPTFQVDGGAFGAYTPTSATMEGTTLGYTGSAPGTFGYQGNE